MDEAGIKFLDKLYQNLYMSDIVQHTKLPSDSRNEAIRKFLERLDRIIKMADNEHKREHLFNLFVDRYVIKEENISSNLPVGYTKEIIIDGQKKSLKTWIDYLCDPSAVYPTWAKVWAFQGMLKMGAYDPIKGIYSTRTENTINSFVTANPAVIAQSIDTIKKLVNKEEINDEEADRLSRTKSFNKLYTFFEKKYKANVITDSNPEDGIWIKYNQGSKNDAIKLSKSVRGTPWCTASEGMAISQVCGPYETARFGGDFYVYYTKGKNDKYTVPRIAIRLRGHTEIGEIRGILDSQNLEPELTDILENKLVSMTNLSKKTVNENLEIVSNLRKLSEIAKKNNDGVKLTEEEIIILYGANNGFGWQENPMAKKIIKTRNVLEDFNSINDKNIRLNMVLSHRLPEKSISDKEVILMAIKEDKIHLLKSENKFFKYISEEVLQDKDFVLKAAKIDLFFTRFLPKEKIDEVLPVALKSIKDNPELIAYFPEYYLESHMDLVKKNVSIDPYIINRFSKEFMQKHIDLVVIAIEQGLGTAIRYIPKEVLDKNPRIVEMALTDPTVVRNTEVETLRKYPQSINKAVAKDGNIIGKIPGIIQIEHPEIIETALKSDGATIRFVPREIVKEKPQLLFSALTSLSFRSYRYDPSIAYRLKMLKKIDKTGEFQTILDEHPDYALRAEMIRTIRNIKRRNFKESIHRLKHVIGLRRNLSIEEAHSKTK